ncbi:universal stress protein [Streptomyces sp. NPDC005438]|uniref:universal stress protein n=1 Tax=Streptomyces sp. NPDC005438 TaxID=3156880 RepID=UPI0033B67473
MDAQPRPPTTVVVGIDGSEHSLRALDGAVAEAALRHVPLELVCGWPWTHSPAPHETLFGPRGTSPEDGGTGHPDPADPGSHPLYRQAEETLRQVTDQVRREHPEVEVRSTMSTEPAADALLRHGAPDRLTVLGTRGRGGFVGLLLGSVSLRVAAHNPGPLLVVRGERRTAPAGELLYGVDDRPEPGGPRRAFEEARLRGARLRVVHAWQYPTYPSMVPPPTAWVQDESERIAQAADQVAREVVASCRPDFPEVEAVAETVYGQPGHALVEASRHADLVLLTVRRRHRRLALQLGPVTHALLHHADCPVLLVPVG